MSILNIIEVNDEVNHDYHGWAGMAAVEEAMREVAKVFNLEIEE